MTDGPTDAAAAPLNHVMLDAATGAVALRIEGATFEAAAPDGFVIVATAEMPCDGAILQPDGSFREPAHSAEALQRAARREAARLLAFGANFDGHRVDATDHARMRLLALQADADDEGEDFAATLDTLDGAVLALDRDRLAGLTKAVADYRKECRLRLAGVVAGIEAGRLAWIADVVAALAPAGEPGL